VTRRRVLGLIAIAVFVCLSGRAAGQSTGRVARIGLIATTPAFKDAFIAALREAGYVEGQNAVIVHRPLGETAVRDVLAERVDVLCASGPETIIVARRATTTVPLIGVDLETDPVASGLAKTLARPGGNVTGIFMDLPELGGKLIQLLREIVPNLSRVGVVWHPDVGKVQFAATDRAARAAGLGVVSLPVKAPDDLPRAFERARRERAGGVVLLSAPILLHQRAQIADLALKTQLPAVSLFPAFPDAGGLLGYGPDFPDMMRRAAGYVVRILHGASPGDLPVERPAKFELIVSVKAARGLGVTIPPSLLLRADRVIE
jgi:putative tryptophan/tyrosine transport system substrate-binding protein